MRGSVLGVGTDIAGSIRIPAICDGTFALRPSVGRIPYAGQVVSARDGLDGVQSCAGPLATSTRDLALFTRCVVDSDPWKLDSDAIFSPWRTVAPKPKLRLGLILEDPYFPLHPPVLRAVKSAAEGLQKAGHDIIALTPPSLKDICLLGFRSFYMDPANTPFKYIAAGGEPVIPALATTALPNPSMPYDPAPLTLEGQYELNEQRSWFKERFRELIVQNDLDAIIMAGNAGTAVPHDEYGVTPYTVVWNVMDVRICSLSKRQSADQAVSGNYYSTWKSRQGC